jgi:polysaccharide biosynthesis protein PelC
MKRSLTVAAVAALVALGGCTRHHRTYANTNMDFDSIRSVAVLPFWNLSKDPLGADRVRDVFATSLLATNAVYVVPTGEVARAVTRLNIATPVTPTADEIVKLAQMLKVDAVITGVLKEYGEVRSVSASAQVVSLSVQMQDGGSGKVVWAAASAKGGIGWGARLLGATGGQPANDVTEAVVDDLLAQLFQP